MATQTAARKAQRTRWLKRRKRVGVIHAKVGTMPAEYLKISPGGAWGFHPDIGDRFPALHSDREGNLTVDGEKPARYRVCEIKLVLGEALFYLEPSW